MYQCIRQASGAISEKSITPSPRFSSGSCRRSRSAAPSRRRRRRGPRRARAPAHEQHEQQARARRSPRRARSPPAAPWSSRASRTAARRSRPSACPTAIGTCQLKISVRLLLFLTCGGSTGDIQWMRWSCHSNWPVRSTTSHFGGAFGFAIGGHRDVAVEVRVQVGRRRAHVLLGGAVGEHARVRLALVAVDRDRLARVVASAAGGRRTRAPAGSSPGTLGVTRGDVRAVVVVAALVVDRVAALARAAAAAVAAAAARERQQRERQRERDDAEQQRRSRRDGAIAVDTVARARARLTCRPRTAATGRSS